jgi:predicted 3-demethylubiquinone-9 3-methyltransferase (glyoxalase superfamily)
MQKVSTFLWFDNQAEQAAKFYVSLFKNSRIIDTSHYGDGMPMPKGTVMVISFELDGILYQAINGGSHYKLTPAVSLSVSCDSQEEVDRLWKQLTADGGQEVQCGWLTDKFGLSWQIVPAAFPALLKKGNTEQVGRMMQAMMQMRKLDMPALQRAYDGS